MDKIVCELFAGVGGFRCGLNHIGTLEDVNKKEKWETVWFNQWEPLDKKTQWAYDCYVNKFGTCLDMNGDDTTNNDINTVDKSNIPNHNLLVGGFPCQDYSVASTLASSKGLEGKKGVLWWDIRDTLEKKNTPFVLLENVDRLLKSPSKQRGRDFGVMLACFRDLGYTVEWRVINAAEYGFQQRRRRVFIFAYKNETSYYKSISKKINYISGDKQEQKNISIMKLLYYDGFFAKSFPIEDSEKKIIKNIVLPDTIGAISESFHFNFENSGCMRDGVIYTTKTLPCYNDKKIILGDILEEGDIDEKFFIPEERLYFTTPDINHSDETLGALDKETRLTWQYIKGGKKIMRVANTGYEYLYSEGPVPMIDEYDKPARTILTSEGGFSRTTHIVRDKKTGRIRLLTPIELERIQGFPSNWTKECLVDGKVVEMPLNKRRFMMGNALVVNLVSQMEGQLSEIFDKE